MGCRTKIFSAETGTPPGKIDWYFVDSGLVPFMVEDAWLGAQYASLDALAETVKQRCFFFLKGDLSHSGINNMI